MNIEIKKLINNRAGDIYEEVVKIRRDFHMRPEVGFDTKETEKYIRDFLEREGIEIIDSSIGVLGLIRGRESDRYIALRADIDALPVQEENQVSYRSIYDNKMHGCGHDGHTAMLLGAAKILNEIRDELCRSVLLIFQPAEEGPNLGGARIFVRDFEETGLIDKIERIHGIHLTNEQKVGCVRVGAGAVTASTDEFDVRIIGEGGHPAKPHKCNDALSIGIKIVEEMESFMSRRMDPFSNSVFSVGMFHSGAARNVIAGECRFEGMIRCRAEEERKIIKDHLRKSVESFAGLYGADFEIEIIHGLPPMVTDENTVKLTCEAAREFILSDCEYRVAGNAEDTMDIGISREPSMYAEDFAYFAEKIPASYIWLGSGNPEKGFVEKHHSPYFDFDEEALKTGVLLLCSLAVSGE